MNLSYTPLVCCLLVFGQTWVLHAQASSKVLALFHFLLFYNCSLRMCFLLTFSDDWIHCIYVVLSNQMSTASVLAHFFSAQTCAAFLFCRALCPSYCKYYCFCGLNHCLCYEPCFDWVPFLSILLLFTWLWMALCQSALFLSAYLQVCLM